MEREVQIVLVLSIGNVQSQVLGVAQSKQPQFSAATVSWTSARHTQMIIQKSEDNEPTTLIMSLSTISVFKFEGGMRWACFAPVMQAFVKIFWGETFHRQRSIEPTCIFSRCGPLFLFNSPWSVPTRTPFVFRRDAGSQGVCCSAHLSYSHCWGYLFCFGFSHWCLWWWLHQKPGNYLSHNVITYA